MSEPMKTLRSDLHNWLRTHGGAVEEFDYEAIHDMADNFLLPLLERAWDDAVKFAWDDPEPLDLAHNPYRATTTRGEQSAETNESEG